MTKRIDLTRNEALQLWHTVRDAAARAPCGGQHVLNAIARKTADVLNTFDDEEYRRLYGCSLPPQLRK